MRADNRYNRALTEQFINNDPQYNFGGWTPLRSVAPETSFWWYKSAFNTAAVYYNSDDFGKNWSVVDVNPVGEANNKSFNNGYFWNGDRFLGVYVLQNTLLFTGSTIQYSRDGIDWSLYSNVYDIVGVNASPNLFQQGNTYYLTILRSPLFVPPSGSGNTIFYSNDLFNWNESDNTEYYNTPDIFTSNGNVGVGTGQPTSVGALVPLTGKTFNIFDGGATIVPNTSLDSLLPSTTRLTGCYWNGTYFLGITNGTPRIVRSSDGITWTSKQAFLPSSGLGAYGMIGVDETAYIFGTNSSYPSSGCSLYSTQDMETFTPVYVSTDYGIIEFFRNGNLFNASILTANNIASIQTRWSEDGTTWYDSNVDIPNGSWGDGFATNS
jgi:hypothetical protein